MGNMHKNACLSWVIWITYAYLPAHPVIFLQEKILKRYVQRHALWDRNGINAVHITWVIVWISGTFQGVVYHRATSCKTKKKVCFANSSQHCCEEFAKQVFKCSKCSSACFLFFDEKTLGSSEELEFTFHGY